MAPSKGSVHQHGVKGAYVGGDWVDIEDCGKDFNIEGGSHTTCDNFSTTNPKCATCPRSRSRYVQSKADGTYDVIIIGAGCVGAAIARELSKSNVSVLVLEAADDVTQGATKGNSGIVHAGFDDTPGTNRAKFCWPGNQMFEELDRELHFGYQKNGSLVLATTAEEVKHLKELKKRGETNGVKRLRIIEKKELFELEPHVNPNAIAALLSPDAGNLIPYEYAIALAENAVDNGVELRIRRRVLEINHDESDGYTLSVDHWEPREYARTMPAYERTVPTSMHEVERSQKRGMGMALMKASICMLCSLAAVYRSAPGLALTMDVPVEQVRTAGAAISLVSAIIFGMLIMKSSGPRQGSGAGTADKRSPVGEGGSKVTVDEMKMGGSGSKDAMDGVTVGVEQYRAKYIVNAAGSYSDKIAAMVGDESFQIKPRLGDYILLNRNQGHLAKHTLFPCPGPLGKGVLVQTTLWGNLILGPTARDTHVPSVMAESIEDIQKFILSKCKNLVPSFDPREVIHTFCGARAKNTRGDWIIEACEASPHCIHAAGIDSPGLAGSPAIALEVVRLLEKQGLELIPNNKFNPLRAPIIRPKDGLRGLKMAVDESKASKVPRENVICKCEKVTEEEVVTALHRSLPIDSTQAIRKRTRAGMGHCQADEENYNCECRVASIINRENKNGGLESVGRRPWPATSSLRQRWIDEEDKTVFTKLMERE